jgi:hypothetical protein
MSDQGFAGWMGEGPDGGPALPLTEQLLRNRGERGPGDTLAVAEARSRAADARQAREEAAGARDPDEAAADMVNRGYSPGLVSGLVQRRRDKETELAAEREKIAKGERVTARVRGMLGRGQIGGLEAARMLDGDFGDAARAGQLERQIARLDEQIAGAQAMIAPQAQRAPDPLESASRRAHEAFVAATRERMAATRAPERPPFGSVSRGAGTEHTGPDCWVCADYGRLEAQRDSEAGASAYAPGEVITTEYTGGMAYR